MAKREIILDTETTGFYCHQDDRLCSFAALEMIDGVLTGRACLSFVNPEREVPEEASRVNGLTWAFLADKPLFRDVAQELRDFIGDSTVVITCWTMDNGYVMDTEFINKELQDAGVDPVPESQWLNVRRWGEEMFGHKQASLNPMLERYGIDKKGRELKSNHGALEDAELLAKLYPVLKSDYEAFKSSDQKAPARDSKPAK